MPNIHPFFVHLPIAFFTLSTLLDLIAFIKKREMVGRAAWWIQIAGTVGLAAALTTGLLAEASIIIPDGAQHTFESHEQIAFVVSALFGGLFLWRVAHRGMLPGRFELLYLLLLVAGVFLIWVGAWFGGELVFTHGVGVMTGG